MKHTECDYHGCTNSCRPGRRIMLEDAGIMTSYDICDQHWEHDPHPSAQPPSAPIVYHPHHERGDPCHPPIPRRGNYAHSPPPSGHFYAHTHPHHTHQMLKICAMPGCGAITPTARCHAHQTNDNQRRNTHPRRKVYDSQRWRRCRAAVLEDASHTCAMCGARATIADHHPLPIRAILAVGGDPCDPATCRALCHHCSGKADGARGAHATA